ncbi:hypothetical protein CBOM_07856 [Ceraceosorus bombacis]|uniref:Uncharacterized protein n=1 Tax=Ceraceosorus bombacis TaxID=401625 RepID=A0A0P1BN21_9BASI|nr:hypothetical protein CBOM_07856 [Ceraceosorus bombacis]
MRTYTNRTATLAPSRSRRYSRHWVGADVRKHSLYHPFLTSSRVQGRPTSHSPILSRSAFFK